MYNKEKQQTYYINNRKSIKEKALQYYYDHKEERQKYNNSYWALHADKYKEKKKEDYLKKKEKIKEDYKCFKYIYHKEYYLKHKKIKEEEQYIETICENEENINSLLQIV